MKSEKIYRPTWAEVDLGALAHNYRELRYFVDKHVKILSVVKADAYGHGIIEVAKRLLDCGTDYLGVASIDEAIKLRDSKIDLPILVFGNILPRHAKEIIDYGITQTVCAKDIAVALANYAKRKKKKAKVHIKVDTGMGRLGIWHANASEFIKDISGLPGIEIEGVYSHLSCADTDYKFTNQQIVEFGNLIKRLKKYNIHIPIYHIANSVGIIKYRNSHFDMVRPGIALYGIYPTEGLKSKVRLRPVMNFKSKVMYIKRVSKGRSISYGRTYITDKPTTIATIPVGYKDGYFRNLSNKSDVLINGRRCRVVGRICMDQMMVDVQRSRVKKGDVVILIGSSGRQSIHAEDIARLSGTIGYEVVCSIGSSAKRIYKL
jgi:alanine racemase